MEEKLQKTPLHQRHMELSAQMSPFAGFDMPIQYKGIVEEHNAVRTRCGVFDVSHMGEVVVAGADAADFVNYIFTNDVNEATPGQCLYGMMLNEHGGVVDDLLVYKVRNDCYMLVINASNIQKDEKWIQDRANDLNPHKPEPERFDVEIQLLSATTSELAVQGPLAEQTIGSLLGIACADLKFYTFKQFDFKGHKGLISRTGYTGEDGFEIYAGETVIAEIWDTLVNSGQCEPCGLGCRDTLRFEVGLPLYGDELGDDITPLEAGLGMFVKLSKPCMVGRDALLAQKEKGVERKIVGLELADRAIPRHGYEVLNQEDEVIGQVTTGYHAISVDKSVAMAMVNIGYAALGTPLKVRIRRKTFPCTVVAKRFYKKSYKK